jgi:hypothetical protein
LTTRKSILQEISNYVPQKNKEDLIEMRAQHAIAASIFLIEMIESTYSADESDQLVKRFISSIKGHDPERFVRSIRKIKESKDNGCKQK